MEANATADTASDGVVTGTTPSPVDADGTTGTSGTVVGAASNSEMPNPAGTSETAAGPADSAGSADDAESEGAVPTPGTSASSPASDPDVPAESSDPGPDLTSPDVVEAPSDSEMVMPPDAASESAGGAATDTEPVASLGCGAPFAADDVEIEESWRGPTRQVLRRTMDVASVQRAYLLTLPVDYDPGRAYTLIFGFHGLDGDREQLRSYMNIERPADADAIVIYPEGLETNRGTGWDLDRDSDDLTFVDALLEKYTSELCIDQARIFATGHSYGGCMSNSVGCYRGEVFRAIAPVAGCGPWLFGPNAGCDGQVAALVIHSPFDTVEDYSSAIQGCNTWLNTNGCDQELECGCYWTESLDEPASECLQTALEPYTPTVAIEVSERDERPPEFRKYVGCDAHYPVVTADYWRRERQDEGDPSERWHNPPPWAPELIWEFFGSLAPPH